MSRIITIANHKGGVGKTTTTLNLSAALSELGRRVLMVDLDPQAGLTIASGINPDSLELSIYHALKKGEGSKEYIVKAKCGVDLFPANIDLALIELELISSIARERRLIGVLESLRDCYDDIIIDCQPSLGLLTMNALAASEGVLIPVACEYLALKAIRGIVLYVQKVRGQINSQLKIIGILPTMFDRRTKHAAETLKQVKKEFEPRIKVLDHVVYRSIKFAESTEKGIPILEYAKALPGADAYRQLARDLILK
jgi:chromosome partitioning protein